jgi:7-cyano-7-deazaguanine reductase
MFHTGKGRMHETRLRRPENMTLKTINNPKISRLTRQIHEVQVPPLCPRTGNPIAGSTLTIQYVPKKYLLEVYSLNEYIASFIGSNEVRDLELLTQVVARDCHNVLDVQVSVIGKYILNIGQTLICVCQSRGTPKHHRQPGFLTPT